ncbi:hypothetical protein [Streptomyces sp. TLI_171]|uniref:hypothetical protein n=1 Tax=Streptomyces sp. TLI_171 TaxID=1938859 RepID=UPI000C190941|nr:hypothetical protein [Streptomyces sp. TLI_171]RKE21986.1 hypothetical protein BX266_5394 [Streptomyces sp. TLI_171]
MPFIRTINSALTDPLPDGEAPIAGRAAYRALHQRGLPFVPVHTGGGYFALSLALPDGEVLVTDDNGQIANDAANHGAWLACFYAAPSSPYDADEDDVTEVYVGDGSLSFADDCAALADTLAGWIAARRADTGFVLAS